MPQSPSIPLVRLLAMGIGVRFFVDTGIQIFAPYLAAIAAGLEISIVALGALISLRSLMGLAAPVLGAVADRIGYRQVMRFLLLVGAAGAFVLAFSWALWIAALGILLMGVGLFPFAPVLQAYMSGQIPYARRSRGLGVVEYGWALASIVGLSVAGLMIDRFGWRAPFLALGAGLLLAFFVFGALPRTRAAQAGTRTKDVVLRWRQWPQRLRGLLTLESNIASTWAAITANGLSVFATSNISIVYGAWLSREYGLTTTRLGLVALVLGLAELSGSVLVSVLGDRLGKYRSVLASMTFSVAAYVLLPFLNFRVLAIVAGLVLLRFLFEVSLVSNISLLSEQVPTQRGKVLTLASAAVTIGVALASAIGPLTYSWWGIWGPGLISAVAALGATVLFYLRVTE